MYSSASTTMTARAEEWQVLQSIYPEFIPAEQPGDDELFLLQVPVQLSEPLPVHIVPETASDDLQTVTLSNLPPISLNLKLPSGYPSTSPPTIHSIQPSNGWLSSPIVERLTRLLLDMWCGESIIGAWIEHIQDGDQLLASLELLYPNSKSVRLLHPSPRLLFPSLVACNQAILKARFQASTHTCPICLNRLLGIQCIELDPCSHVACRACLGEFWGKCIAEGDVLRVGCPDPECIKDGRRVSITDVEAVVTPEEVERWQWLLGKQETERDPTIIHCPVTSCQLPVRPPSPVSDGQRPEYARLRTCACGYSFCMYCRRAWHGPHTSCSQLTTATFIQSYLQHSEGSAERQALERRYGRNNILRTVAKYQEEQANRQWMDDNSMACPGCEIRVEKMMGCNHMTCARCRQHFCYLCGTKLQASRPYIHFNIPGHPCYYKLFDTPSQNEDHWVAVEGFDLQP